MLRKFKISIDGTAYLVEMEEVGATATPADAVAAPAAPGRTRPGARSGGPRAPRLHPHRPPPPPPAPAYRAAPTCRRRPCRARSST